MGRPRTWTDEQLRAAVAVSKSYAEVMRRIGIRPQGSCFYDVKGRISELQLDTHHFMRRSSASYPWAESAIRAAVASASTRVDVLSKLAVSSSSANLNRLARHMAELGIGITGTNATRTKKRRWTDDQLRATVASSVSMRSVIASLGLVPAGGNYSAVQRRVQVLGLDTSHFTGAAWRRGKTFTKAHRLPLELVLVAGRWTGSQKLKQRLIREGLLPQECQLCGWAQKSLDGRIPVELDHINGDNSDNRLENLRILCPNCHSLQPTHRGSNQKRRRARVSER